MPTCSSCRRPSSSSRRFVIFKRLSIVRLGFLGFMVAWNFPAVSAKWTQHVFDTTVDHYNFQFPAETCRSRSNATFPLRYFVNDDYFVSRPSSVDIKTTNDNTTVVLFYAGNEANIVQFVNNSGFLTHAAKQLTHDNNHKVLVVFAEHRYYGKSYPFGGYAQAVGNGHNISYCTVEQAMQDFNLLNLHIRQKWNLRHSDLVEKHLQHRTTQNPTTHDNFSWPPDLSTPFVVFGGSYGGNLALWLRLKHANLWAGAIASSATPLKHLLRQSNAFAKIVTDVYANVSIECPNLVRRGWKELYSLVPTSHGRKILKQELHLCHLPEAEDNDSHDLFEHIHGWIGDALETLVQYGYPYPTNFYNPVPAYPFQVACKQMIDSATRNETRWKGLGALRAAVNVFYNSTGKVGSCFDFESHVQVAAYRHWSRKGQHDRLFRLRQRQTRGPIDGTSMERNLATNDNEPNHMDAWGYQTCTEVYQPMPANGITDFEVPYTPNHTAYFEECRRRWGVTPRPNWEEMTFQSDVFGPTGTNIFLTNGQLDPWRAAGIQWQPKGSTDETIKVRLIEDGAHHLDLRAPHPLDPPSVVKVRKEQVQEIKKWVKEWRILHAT